MESSLIKVKFLEFGQNTIPPPSTPSTTRSPSPIESMELGPNWYQIENKACYIPKLSKFCVECKSMLSGFKLPSLACKCVFYRPKHVKRRPHGVEL